MKRVTKIWFTAACSMLVLGFVFALIGKELGGSKWVEQWIYNGDLSFGPLDFLSMDVEFDDVEFDSDRESYSGDVAVSAIADTEDITDLLVAVGGAELKLKVSEDNTFYFSSDNAPRYQCYVQGNTLYLKSRRADWIKESEIVLYIPENWEFKDISMEIGGGVISADALRADHIQVEVGAGTIRIDALEAEELSVEIGAGEVDLFNVKVQDGELDVGMGQLLLEGSVSGNLDAECAMGSMKFTMYEKEEDHNYELECAMGSLHIGGNSYEGLATERYIDNHADFVYKLNCSTGKITMTFQ